MWHQHLLEIRKWKELTSICDELERPTGWVVGEYCVRYGVKYIFEIAIE